MKIILVKHFLGCLFYKDGVLVERFDSSSYYQTHLLRLSGVDVETMEMGDRDFYEKHYNLLQKGHPYNLQQFQHEKQLSVLKEQWVEYQFEKTTKALQDAKKDVLRHEKKLATMEKPKSLRGREFL